ncbi:MAG: hypothetical protein ABIQ93_17400, partial [Saprospiraceae bacterium]
IVLDPNAPATNMWLLSNVKIEETWISARVDRAKPAFVQQFHFFNKNDHRNDILLHVKPEITKTYGDTLSTRLNFADITKIEVFELNAGKTVGLVLGAAVAIGVVVVAIACGCPYVYTETPEGIKLEGELYAGAVYPQLERHDWLALDHLPAVDQQYRIHMANKLPENQRTNLLELEVIDHAPGIRPLFDKYGRLHTLRHLQPPATATNVSGADVLAAVRAEDDNIFLGDLQNDRSDATERLTLTFAKPATARQAKLLIHAKTTDWLSTVYHQFQVELGEYGPKMRQKSSKKSADKILGWMERQKIPLAVWLETRPGKWKKVDYFQGAGSIAFKNDVLAIDLSGVQGDSLRLRLEYGFHFWEIDYAALDFSPDVPIFQHTLWPVSAITNTGEDVTQALIRDDAAYYNQPNIDDEARVTFAAPPGLAGQERSLILHAKGHYEIYHEPVSGRPGVFQLMSWNKENALPRLSRERWQETRQLAAKQ